MIVGAGNKLARVEKGVKTRATVPKFVAYGIYLAATAVPRQPRDGQDPKPVAPLLPSVPRPASACRSTT